MDTRKIWEKVGELPPPTGFKKNIGLSNMFHAEIEGKIIIGGGANFPYLPAVRNGERIEHKDILLVIPIDNTFHILDKRELDFGIADGKAVVFNNILFYIGNDKIIKINILNSKLHIETYFTLPFSIKNCIAEQKDGYIYYGLGTINGEVTNRFFCFNIFTKENIEIINFPAAPRTQAVSTIFNNDIVVFSGGNRTAYTEGYKFDIKKKIWQTLNDVNINGKDISLIGAGHTKVSEHELLVIGGFNEEVWNNAQEKFATLEGEERNKFREFYLSQNEEYFNWNKEILLYNYNNDSWKSLGTLPFAAPCGNTLILYHYNLYTIMGEIRPGIRTPNIFRTPIDKLIISNKW